jgi:hypothetical protein
MRRTRAIADAPRPSGRPRRPRSMAIGMSETDLRSRERMVACVSSVIKDYRGPASRLPEPRLSQLAGATVEELCHYLAARDLRQRKTFDRRGQKPDFAMQILLARLDRLFAAAGLTLSRLKRTRGEEPLNIVQIFLRCAGVRHAASLEWQWKRRGRFPA